ncbi:MAG: hypothetical protein J5606_10510 [Bacteroidales bacterium]|nr:hypothetical protein [Bacteroidales bacterium]
MIVLHDYRLSDKAVKTLSNYAEPLAFDARNTIAFSALAGHADIFCCTGLSQPVLAPNTPQYIIEYLKSKNIDFQYGKTIVGDSKDVISAYNVAISRSFVVHNRHCTDPVIMQNLQGKTYIHVKQSFARCSTMVLPDDNFITSDKAIFAKLSEKHVNCLYVNPEQIVLPSLNYGLIGGCMGVCDKQVFVSGSLKNIADGEKMRSWITDSGFDIVELDTTSLFDGGGLLFV